jgi:hypothetical protein
MLQQKFGRVWIFEYLKKLSKMSEFSHKCFFTEVLSFDISGSVSVLIFSWLCIKNKNKNKNKNIYFPQFAIQW